MKEENQMKRLLCLLLALCLLGGLPALADEDDWEYYDSIFGYSLRYPSFIMETYGVPAEEEGRDMEVFVAADEEEEVDASLTCYMIQDDDSSDWEQDNEFADWEAKGFRPVQVHELDFELKTVMDMYYRMYISQDQREMLELIMLDPSASSLEPAGAYVFAIRYPVGNPGYWRDIILGILNTLEFPRQGTHVGAFDLLYDLCGDISLTDVVVDEDAEPLFLYPDAGVTNLRLEKVTWNDETFTVAGTETLCAVDSFNGEEALRIFCYFEDFLPVLRVKAVNAQGEEECWYLSISGRNGSLQLLEESWFY